MDVLMVTFDAGGNIPPFVGLGQELRRRGHQARCLGPRSIQAAVERAGMAFRRLEHGAVFDPLARQPADQARGALLRVFLDDGYGRDLRTELGRACPDVTVIDCLLVGAQAAAEAVGGPYALLLHTLPGYLKDRFALTDLNAVRARIPLPPVASNAELWLLADRALVASTPLLDDFDRTTVPGLRYVGPIFESDTPEEKAAAAEVPHLADALVLVTFSTTYMDQEPTLGCIIEAVRRLSVQVLVTGGPAVDLASLPVATNVSMRAWVPHRAVLPRTALVITHAGHGTVAMALSHGVPLLCLPLGRDQTFIARRVEDLGAGLAMSPGAPAPALRAAITALLDDNSYRRAAQRVAAAIRATGPGAANAAAELETMVAHR